MATLLDTSALAVLIRRTAPGRFADVRSAARAETESGRTLVSAVTAVELLVGVRGRRGERLITELLESLPVVAADREVAVVAGRLGASARARGATIPVPDLVIAATAIQLDLPLLTCDSDFTRGRSLGQGARPDRLWARLRLHPATPR